MGTLRITTLTILHLISTGWAADWSYLGEKGSDRWHEDYQECGGQRQSPINVDTELSQFDPSLSAVNIHMPAESVGRMILIHNGHTLQVNTIGEYYVYGGGLPSNYRMAQFHLHWGQHNRKGSEHQINGQYFPMELHIVSYDYMNYSSIAQAMKAPMGLAVLGTLFTISKEDNPVLEPLISAVKEVNDPDERDTTEIVTLRLKDLLPGSTSRYYRYNGSLTTPGCYESVVWTVFEEKQTISKRQIRILRDILKPANNHPQLKTRLKLVNNYRPIQPLNGRQLLRSYPRKGEIPTAALKTHQAVWSYKGNKGPINWKAIYPNGGCDGASQSPINIAEQQTVYEPSLTDFHIEMPPIEANPQMTVLNNGHTIKVHMGESGDYYVQGGGLPNSTDYKVAQLHFHWGGEDNKGSEHHLNGHAYPIELHIVTYDSGNYATILEAVTKPQGLAVLGVLFEVGQADNPALQPVVDVMASVADPEHDRKMTISGLDLHDLLPEDTSQYFRYNGSLTTPGCYESVIWTVFKNTQKLSHKQLREFREVLKHQDDHGEGETVLDGGQPPAGHVDVPTDDMVKVGDILRERLVDNYRPVQPINDRTVLRSYQHIEKTRRRGGSHSHHWGYTGHAGPAHWHTAHGDCRGQQQSPINIVTSDTEFNPTLTEFSFYDSPDIQSEMAVSNNGHTVKVNIKQGVHYVFGGGLPTTYTTAQLHFHWGSNDIQGSEHTIDGHAFPLELHVVNYDNGKHSTILEAVDQPQGLAVLGTLFYLSKEDNKALQPILNSFTEIMDPEYKTEHAIQPLRIEELLPADTAKYYRYNGSLTTPGCFESVVWTVFEEKMPISLEQMEQFREILLPKDNDESEAGETIPIAINGDTATNGHVKPETGNTDLKPVEISNSGRPSRKKMVDNFRPIQPLNDRKVWRSFNPSGSKKMKQHWSYEGKQGPANWASLHPDKNCDGQRQSPIDIQRNQTKFDSNLRDINIWYDPPLPGSKMVVQNNGHTVKVNLKGKYFLTGAGLTKVYKTVQFHFHWGDSAHTGSEHTLDQQAFPLELHIVNYDWETYSNITEAMTQPLGLAVFGVFYTVSDNDNPVLQALINALEKIEDPNLGTEVELEAISVKYFLPDDRSRYYRYNGSLTTPGCYESVIWTLFEQPQTISRTQLKKFWNMFQKDHDEELHGGPSYTSVTEKQMDKPTSSSDGKITVDQPAASPTGKQKHKGRKRIRTNYRPVQDLNERQVYRSFENFSEGRTARSQMCAGTDNLSPHLSVQALISFSLIAKFLSYL